MTYDSLVNHGDYLSAHYLAEMLPKDLKAKDGLLARWAAAEEEARRTHAAAVAEAEHAGTDPAAVSPRARTPREGLRALHGPYFADRADFAQDAATLTEPDAPLPADWSKRLTGLHLAVLRALGYGDAHEQPVTVHRSGQEHTLQATHAEPGLIALSCGWTTEPDAALDPDGAGRLLHPIPLDRSDRLTDGKAAVDFLFECDEPPRYVLLLAGGVLTLADRTAWHDGRYLAADLDAALHRRDDRNGGELDTLAALFGADALRIPDEGGAAPLAGLVEKSAQHAVGVSTELREGLRLSVEWIANAVLERMREQGVDPARDMEPAALAKRLTRESLRYLYRILFLLYAEAQPALGILPSDAPEYTAGYGLQRLGDLVVRDLVGERSRRGFHLYDSLDLLFRQVEHGHREYGSEPGDLLAEQADREAARAEQQAAEELAAGAITRAEHDERLREAARARRAAARTTGEGLRFEPLRSELFKKDAVTLISADGTANPLYDDDGTGDGDGPGDGGADANAAEHSAPHLDLRLRNETLHRVLRRLMLTRGKGRERGGFISYAQLGINQLGAVYEGLMSYTGFIAEERLYEVARNGDASGGSWMVPASRAADYPDEAFVRRTDEETGRPETVVHPEGSFVYRLAGRDRQTSASYYTPKSLTEVTVELALGHRLDQDGTVTPARELLEWTICEPALGSGAFLNEAIDQVAAEYLRRRERETGRRIDPEQRQIELQKTKAYIALHNAYGVDLNATAVELAEVSLWLNTMHPGMRAPWFGLHLRRGNSLVGAGRRIYGADDVTAGKFLEKKHTLPPAELPFRDGPLPDGAVHHFLLPAVGWGAVASEREAKDLAPEQAGALAAWRRGVQKRPKAPTPFKEKENEPDKERRARYARWLKKAEKTELHRLQGAARRVEYLWDLVAKRLQLSERKVARTIDVWGADWLQPASEAADKQQILDGLTAQGTPYWRLKTVMDAWCALWFWPLDKVAELDGTARDYQVGGPVVTEKDIPALLRGETPQREAEEGPGEPEEADEADETAAPEPAAPAPGDVLWTSTSLFDHPYGEQGTLDADFDAAPKQAAKKKSRSGRTDGGTSPGRTPEADRSRRVVPLKTLADWLDFLEAVLGRADLPEDALLARLDGLTVDEALPELTKHETAIVDMMGMDGVSGLQRRFPWLHTVVDLAGQVDRENPIDDGGLDIFHEDGHGFFHWELHFAHVFQSPSGGFDLQVGNPPWVVPEWEESVLLAEYDPWFGLTDKASQDVKTTRRQMVVGDARARRFLLDELAAHSGLVETLGSGLGYPLLVGAKPDLYRAFMCRVWEHMGTNGSVGLLHPDSHFTGDRDGHLREEAYKRLRVHGDFVNAGNRFFPPPVGRSSHFGVHVYGTRGEISFDHLSWLFSVDALRHSHQDDGTALDPGIRYGNGWDERPHAKRVIRVDENVLALWSRLTGSEQPLHQTRLLSPVSTAEAAAIEALSDYRHRLGDYDPQISSGYNESTAKVAGLIRYNTPDKHGAVHQPTSWSEVILRGPQIGLANPLFKQPSQGGGEVRGLDPLKLADNAVPESEYLRVADRVSARQDQDSWTDLEGRDASYVDFNRMAWREMIAPDTERSLYVAVIPKGAAHVDFVHSATLQGNRLTVLAAGFWSGIPIDYLLRTVGIGHLKKAPARRMPAPTPRHPLASALLLRTLRLNCLTSAYADLWGELYDPLWPGYEPWAAEWEAVQPLHEVRPEWKWETPLRTERARRMALVEIDALVAVWLGVSADALVAMYKSRFPVMQDFDRVTWFDAKGRKIAGNRYTFGFDQTKEHYEDFLKYQSGELEDPPEGYTAPFYKANREEEMRIAHAYFSERLQKAVDRGEWSPPSES